MNKKQLFKSVIWAGIIAAIVLVTAVLPAEYNVDPLGAGKLFGFDKLYFDEDSDESIGSVPKILTNKKRLKLDKAGSDPSILKPVEAQNPPPAEQLKSRADEIELVVAAGKGIEYKVKALKLGSVKYDWSTKTKDILYSDFHGEVLEENPPAEVFYESYTLAYANNMAGTFTAPFDGKHGWYFRNESYKDIKVTLHLKGQYDLLEEFN